MFVAFYYIEKKQSDFEISIILIFALFAFQMRISGALLIIPLLPIFFVRGLGNAIKITFSCIFWSFKYFKIYLQLVVYIFLSVPVLNP